MSGSYEAAQRQQPFKRNSGSTAIEFSSHLYPPNQTVHHHGHNEHDPYDDTASMITVVAPQLTEKDPTQPSIDDSNPRNGLAGRTPSPTPSELKELKTGAINWQSMKSWKFWFRREWLWYYVAIVIAVVLTALITIFHKQIVRGLTPAANWLHDTTGGWLVPIAILFVISFPPLFGHEIVAILCGLVWGLWIGFGIVAAGTLLGEIGNFYAFKYCCRSRGAKMERNNISYACLAKVVRDGGFKIALVARFSAIPGHFTTAVFSTCGMGIIVFTLAAILSMPKQVVTVYLGVVLEQSESGPPDKNSTILSNIVLGITVIVTIAAMWYIVRQMNKVKPQVIYRRRKARQAKLFRAGTSSMGIKQQVSSSESTIVFNPSVDFVPLKTLDASVAPHQSHQPPLEAPQPRRPLSILHNPLHHSRDLSSPDSDTEPTGPYSSRSRAREESTDDVGWDTGVQSRTDLPYHLGSEPFMSRSADRTHSTGGREWV